MKLFDKILLEYADAEQAKLASHRFSQLENMVDDDLMKSCSFAIWDKNTRNAMAVLDNMDLMRYDVIAVGMNQSQGVSDFGIFHQERCSSKLRNAFDGPLNKYYGAFVTDLLNIMDNDGGIIPEPSSEKLIEYLKTADGIKNRQNSKKRFLKIYNAITIINNGKEPYIIAMGDEVQESLYQFGIDSNLVVPHPASRKHAKMDVYIASVEHKRKVSDREWDGVENPILKVSALKGRIGHIKHKNIQDTIERIKIYTNECEHKENFSELKKAYSDNAYIMQINADTIKSLDNDKIIKFFDIYDFYKNLNIKNGYIVSENLESLLNKLLQDNL